jgi:hypothetical protein
MILEPWHTFIIHTETVDLGITLGQPPLDVGNSFITALSCNDFPSQQQSEGHITLGHDGRNTSAGISPSDAASRQVATLSFAVQSIYNHIRPTGVIMNLLIVVLDQLQPPSLLYVQINLSENVLQALMVSEDMNHIPKKVVPPCP